MQKGENRASTLPTKEGYMESTNVTLRQRLIGIAIALVLIVGACLIPGSEA